MRKKWGARVEQDAAPVVTPAGVAPTVSRDRDPFDNDRARRRAVNARGARLRRARARAIDEALGGRRWIPYRDWFGK
jgi:hypothetical protein